uniref:Uncharacterized protein n=1 Tax=viral metagenome TaxID=1070528 RepID=A0A6C0HSP1_9ZZZZ
MKLAWIRTTLRNNKDAYFYTNGILYNIGNIASASFDVYNNTIIFTAYNSFNSKAIRNVISGRMINSDEVDSDSKLKDGVLNFYENGFIEYVTPRIYNSAN